MVALQGENALLNSYKSSMQNLEQDKSALEEKVQGLEVQVHSLEASLQESQANANIMANIDTSGEPRHIKSDFKTVLTIKVDIAGSCLFHEMFLHVYMR